jgi:hypothetical protein
MTSDTFIATNVSSMQYHSRYQTRRQSKNTPIAMPTIEPLLHAKQGVLMVTAGADWPQTVIGYIWVVKLPLQVDVA